MYYLFYSSKVEKAAFLFEPPTKQPSCDSISSTLQLKIKPFIFTMRVYFRQWLISLRKSPQRRRQKHLVEINNGFTGASECGIDAFLPSSLESVPLSSARRRKGLFAHQNKHRRSGFRMKKKNSNHRCTLERVIIILSLQKPDHYIFVRLK
jgi:hypothetical protein